MIYSVGDKTLPCGTPLRSGKSWPVILPTCKFAVMFWRKLQRSFVRGLDATPCQML